MPFLFKGKTHRTQIDSVSVFKTNYIDLVFISINKLSHTGRY